MLCIKNGITRLKTNKEVVYQKTDILIEGNRIIQIKPEIDIAHVQTIDASGMLVIPGLINSHLHSHDNFNKGWLDNLPLEIWMAVVRPFFTGIHHTPQQVYLRTLLGATEMLHSGVTTVMDDVILNGVTDQESLDMIIKAYQDIGIRAIVSPHTKNIPMEKTIPYADKLFTSEMKKATAGPFPEEKEILDFFEKNLDKYADSSYRVSLGLSDSAPQRCTLSLMRGVKELAQRYSVPVSCHVLETYVQKCTGELFYGKSLVQYLYDFGLLDENFVLIHCNWVSEEDISLIRLAGSKAVHNPVCNMKMGSGIAPVHHMLKNFPVGLGTDNISANDNANIFEAMKIGALLSKIKTADYKQWIGAEDVVNMATEFGGLCVGQADLGSLEEGKKADITILDLKNEQFLLGNDYDKHLAYTSCDKYVRCVIVDGRIVMKDGSLTMIDQKLLYDRLKEIQSVIDEEHRLALQESKDLIHIFEECYLRCNAGREKYYV